MVFVELHCNYSFASIYFKMVCDQLLIILIIIIYCVSFTEME